MSREWIRSGVSVQILTYRYSFIARLTKAARRFGNLGSFLARVAGRSPQDLTHVSCARVLVQVILENRVLQVIPGLAITYRREAELAKAGLMHLSQLEVTPTPFAMPRRNSCGGILPWKKCCAGGFSWPSGGQPGRWR
jgi:hypothetical protein